MMMNRQSKNNPKYPNTEGVTTTEDTVRENAEKVKHTLTVADGDVPEEEPPPLLLLKNPTRLELSSQNAKEEKDATEVVEEESGVT